MKRSIIAAVAGIAAFATVAVASIPNFVGKGDVQTVFGWNNAALQRNAADVEFRYLSETVNEWTCSRVNSRGKEIIQERNNTATAQATIATAARVRGQVSGFELTSSGITESVDGPAIGSCPSGQGADWTYDDNLSTDHLGGGLQVRVGPSGSWQDLY
jgi:hypothetical protein